MSEPVASVIVVTHNQPGWLRVYAPEKLLTILVPPLVHERIFLF